MKKLLLSLFCLLGVTASMNAKEQSVTITASDFASIGTSYGQKFFISSGTNQAEASKLGFSATVYAAKLAQSGSDTQYQDPNSFTMNNNSSRKCYFVLTGNTNNYKITKIAITQGDMVNKSGNSGGSSNGSLMVRTSDSAFTATTYSSAGTAVNKTGWGYSKNDTKEFEINNPYFSIYPGANGQLPIRSLTIYYDDGVSEGPQEPTWTLGAPGAMTYGDGKTVDATSYLSGGGTLTPTWTVERIAYPTSAVPDAQPTDWSDAVAIANPTDEFTPNAGWYRITCSTPGDETNYLAKTDYSYFKVGKATQTISFADEKDDATIEIGVPFEIEISGVGSALGYVEGYGNADVEFRGNIVIVTGKVAEDDIIDFYAKEDENYMVSNELSYTFTIIEANGITPFMYTPSAEKGEDGERYITLTYPDNIVKFESAKEGCTYSYTITPDENGATEIEGEGNSVAFNGAGLYILETHAENTEGKTLDESVWVRILKGQPKVAWSKDALTVDMTEQHSPEVEWPVVTVKPNYSEFKTEYSSTNTAVATIDENGRITLVGKGKTTIEAMAIPQENTEVYKNYDVSEVAQYLLEVTDEFMPAVVTFNPETSENVAIGTKVTMTTATEGAVISYKVTVGENAPQTYTAEGNSVEYVLDQLGEVTIEAWATNNDRTCEAKDEIYEVVKAQPTLTFKEAVLDEEGNVQVNTVDGAYEIPVNTATLEGWYGVEGEEYPAITYTIARVEGDQEATIDETTGEVTYKGTAGEFIITAKVAGNAFNEGAEQSYTLIINEEKHEVTYDFQKNTYGMYEFSGNAGKFEPGREDGNPIVNEIKNGVVKLQFNIDNVAENASTYRYWSTKEVRIYAGVKLEFTADDGYVITGINFIADGSYLNMKDSEGNVVNTKASNWVANKPSQSVSFNLEGQCRLYSITVNYRKLQDANVSMFGAGINAFEWEEDIDLSEYLTCADGAADHLDVSIAPKDVTAFRMPTEKEYTANYMKQHAAQIMSSDSWLYTAEQVGTDWTENTTATLEDGKFSVKVPCSGEWVITVAIKEGDSEFAPMTKTFDVVVTPTLAGLKFNYFGTDLKAGHMFVPEVVSDNPVYTKRNVLISLDGYLYDIYYKLPTASSEEPDYAPARRGAAPEGYTKYEITHENGVPNTHLDMTDATGINLVVSKNGTDSSQSNEGGHNLTINDDFKTAVEGIYGDVETDSEVAIFTINGVRVNAENLQPGMYIVVSGNSTRKIMVK